MDQCLRDRVRYYHLEDLVEAVNRMLERYDFYPVSQRMVQQDLKFMQSGTVIMEVKDGAYESLADVDILG